MLLQLAAAKGDRVPRKILPLLACCLLTLVMTPIRALADDSYSGTFSGPQLSMEITADGGSYTGTIHRGEQAYPFKAQANAGQLVGTFTTNGHEYSFTATFSGDNLTFSSGTSTYQLTRAAGNPLSPNPSASDSSNAPPGYSVAASTDVGKAWVTKKSGITTVTAALEATFSDLAKFFNSRIVIKGAFEDTRDHLSGAASFTSTFAGQPIVGLVTCKIEGSEDKMSVTYCLASATPADWAKLNTAATPKPAFPAVKLTRFDFPDGTGSVGIADGWTLKNSSLVDPLYVTGPAGQSMGAPGLWW